MVKPKKLYHINHGSYFGHFSISTDNFVKISLGRSCNHGISELASLFVIETNTRVRNGLIWLVNTITISFKTVYNVTAKMLWPRSLGRNGSQLFVIIKLICRAIRSCIMEILFWFLPFAESDILRMILYGQVFIAKIIISHKEPARVIKMCVVLILLVVVSK